MVADLVGGLALDEVDDRSSSSPSCFRRKAPYAAFASPVKAKLAPRVEARPAGLGCALSAGFCCDPEPASSGDYFSSSSLIE